MADYQVIQPGLNSMTHKGLPLEPNPKLVMTGLFSYYISNIIQASLHIFCLELMDESCFSLDVPVFLPPLIFSKLDKPSKFALVTKPEW